MEGVGVTAKMTAAARARESERADRLFDDPWAASLSGDEGFDFLAREEALLPDRPEAVFVVRHRFFDDFLLPGLSSVSPQSVQHAEPREAQR
jgi:O-methyltransferase involved in polyketide biosynthesis